MYGLPSASVPTSVLELPDLCLPDAGGANEAIGTPLTPHAIATESVSVTGHVGSAAVSPAAGHVGQASSVPGAAAAATQPPASPVAETWPSAASRVRAMIAALDKRAAGLPPPPPPVPATPPVMTGASSVRRSPSRDIMQSQVIRIQRLVITPPTTPRSANAAVASPRALRMQQPLPFMGNSPPQAASATTAAPVTPPATSVWPKATPAATTASPKAAPVATTERDSVIKVARAAEAAEAAAQAAVVAAEAVASAVEAAAAQAEQRASKNKRRMQRVHAPLTRPTGSGRASRSPNRRVRRQARPGTRQLPGAESEGGAEGSGGTGPSSHGSQLPRPEANMYVGGSDADDDDADAAEEALWPGALLSESLRVNTATGSPMPRGSSQDPQDPLSIAIDAMLD